VFSGVFMSRVDSSLVVWKLRSVFLRMRIEVDIYYVMYILIFSLMFHLYVAPLFVALFYQFLFILSRDLVFINIFVVNKKNQREYLINHIIYYIINIDGIKTYLNLSLT
jgi:hypothetical protein